MTDQDKETVQRVEKADKAQRASEAKQDSANDNRPQENVTEDKSHFVGEPTEEDYERARTVGIANEPELPPGKVENGGVVRGQSV